MRSPLDILFGVKGLLTRRSVVFNACNAPATWPKALLLYKTDPLFNPRLAGRYTHTNNWEIMEMCRVLHEAGFQVDVVDRSEDQWTPRDEYSIFIGDASGRAGWRYKHYASNTPSAMRVFYATSPDAELAKSNMLSRYEAFESRTGIQASPMRVPHNVDILGSMAQTDVIFCLSANGFSADSYKQFSKPIFEITASTSPAVQFDSSWMMTRNINSFLCFTGVGFVVKGVDLVVEAFAQMPGLTVHIAGLDNDADFWAAYEDLIESCPNIVFEGFLSVSGRRFKELCGECSFVILPSSSEGFCTSVATAMRAALVPITTYSTAIDDGSAGFMLPSNNDVLIDAIVRTASRVSQMDSDEYRKKVADTQRAAATFSQAGFTTSFSQALFDALAMHHRNDIRI